MTSFPIAATLGVGFVLGLRHALEADHVAAVAALGRGDGGMRRAVANGVSWGLGHATMLGLAGGAAIALRASFPPGLARAFELAVAAMLIGLGCAALRGAFRDRLHVHRHAHGDVDHAHLHFHAAGHAGADDAPPHDHVHPFALGLRPFLVGSVHGLAGSGALALLALATVPTAIAGLLYLVVFGAGSIAGMMLMSVVVGAPLVLAHRRAERAALLLRGAAGAGSLAIGVMIAWETARAFGWIGAAG